MQTLVKTEGQQLSRIRIRINGTLHEFEIPSEIKSSNTLAYLLRERLGLTGLKVACDEGACGACTILMDGRAVLSCMMLAVDANGHDVVTIEGLSAKDPVVEAFAEQCEPGYGTAMQCGYCTPGWIMVAKAFLNEKPRPTVEDVRQGFSGNVCRCGCYPAIVRAVLHAAERMKGEVRK